MKYLFVATFLILLSCNDQDTGTAELENNSRDSVTSIKTLAIAPDSIIKIPVIFHILYSNDLQNISTDSILAELKNVQNDFLLLNRDVNIVDSVFKNRIGNAGINFFLADTIMQNQGEKGIIRLKVNNRHQLYKKSKIINPERYLNVYIGNISSDGFVNTNPWTFPADDAIHLNYRYVGSRYRLMTHETGHWLGLWHTYEDGCSSNGDEVDDTPPQKKATDSDCETCPPDATDQTCGNGPSNYNNFMDYSGCRVMFTKGQVDKMHLTIRSYRKKLSR
jgi:hypothetical protein